MTLTISLRSFVNYPFLSVNVQNSFDIKEIILGSATVKILTIYLTSQEYQFLICTCALLLMQSKSNKF